MVKLSVDVQRALNKFQVREYQRPIAKAFEEDGFKKLLIVMPRRAGKDIIAWNLMIRAAIKTVGVYFYCLPTFKQARLVIWDSITNDGKRFIDFIPPQLIDGKPNSSEMKIKLFNGSIIQLIGSDTYDTSLVGTNAKMIVFSEYSLADPRAYTYARPLLNANNGSVIIISTPRGKNHLFDLYEIARLSPEWFCYKLTLDDTQHISQEAIEREVARGEVSQGMANQEYYCSFELGQEGAVYSKYIDRMRLDGKITDVPWESNFPVHTAWDLGVRDATAIVFFQVIGSSIHIINCYEQASVGLEHYIKKLSLMDYKFEKHIAPHDIAVREFGTGMSRLEKARDLGINFMVAKRLSLEDGIEAVRSTLPKIYIDEKKCAPLIKALENYHYEFDSKRNVYSPQPVHDRWSNFCDSMRYLCISLSFVRKGLSPEDLEKRYQEAMYGGDANLPEIFRTGNRRF